MFDAMLTAIIKWDQKIWYRMNVSGQNTLMNHLAPYLRNPLTWIPLYLFLAIFIPYKFGKKGFYWCIGFLVTFALSDYSSASIIKPWVHRIRPCNDPVLQKTVHLMVDCGSGYSFPSTHATNHFALAFFMLISLHKYYKWLWFPALLWAFSVAYAQVYVGVHFPLDVLCGALLGSLIGVASGRFFVQKVGLSAK
jgi:membrane-associated phospholipid phosphatase